MSTTTSTSGTGAAAPTPTDYSQANKRKTGSEFGLDKDAFLKILVSQLQNQNPSSPGDSQEYVQQMTSYSMLEQLTNISDAVSAQRTDSSGTAAVALVGRNVTYRDKDGVEHSGQVKSVSFSEDDGATLTVGDTPGIALPSITEVRSAP